MFQRNISVEEVKFVLQFGSIINEYSDDRPYPCKLVFALCNSRQLHVVFAENTKDNELIIITTYEASPEIWEDDFATRKK